MLTSISALRPLSYSHVMKATSSFSLFLYPLAMHEILSGHSPVRQFVMSKVCGARSVITFPLSCGGEMPVHSRPRWLGSPRIDGSSVLFSALSPLLNL